MNYRHAFHAGNFADVVKHLAMVDVLLHLKKKDKPFFVLDTHAGRGLYDLTASEATRTGEAGQGIARLQPVARENLPDALRVYLQCVDAAGASHYPGSPLIAAQMLRATDRLIAIEKHPEDVAALKSALTPFRNAKALAADGYERLSALLPPPERRGLILIDPPYEAEDEFHRAADALARAWRRFATGTYLLWFPIKSKSAAESFCGEILASGAEKILRIDVDVRGDKEKLTAAGLIILNPPFELDKRMAECGKIIAPLLSQSGTPATLTIRFLAGG